MLKLYEELHKEEVSVLRGNSGLSQPCRIDSLVVGDVILLEAGMRIPGDCLLFEGLDVTVDEARYNEGKEKIVKKIPSTK